MPPMCCLSEEKKEHSYHRSSSIMTETSEREIWENMTPAAWHNSIASKGSVFNETYRATRAQIERQVKQGGHDIVVEVGCGTGDVIGELDLPDEVPRYGLDINEDFLDFCRNAHDHCEFLVEDALTLTDWWATLNADGRYKKPLITCVNNTLNIMPEDIRGQVLSQMIQVAGSEGRCLVTYWNGNFFSHAVMNYYKANEALCGAFDVKQHVDWNKRCLLTPTGYSTEWMLPLEVQKLMRAYDVDVDAMEQNQIIDQDHFNVEGLAIFLWFSEESTSRAKIYYDSEDAQKFYNNIWGEETIHIGRYDLLTSEDKTTLSKHQQISRAQELHEQEFIKLVKDKFASEHSKIRIVDFGCGYGGLLRRLYESGVVWTASGCDISVKMCDQARALNAKLSADCDRDITILEESYLDVSVPSESADLVVSMDALLHVGPERQHRAIQEAARILRPGGWMIFTDIMEKETVNPKVMQPIYDRIHLSKLGTVSNYKVALENAGFSCVEFQEHSSNVAAHYGTVCEVLAEKGQELGISSDYQLKMEAGLRTWRDLAPKNINWGFTLAQKTEKVEL